MGWKSGWLAVVLGATACSGGEDDDNDSAAGSSDSAAGSSSDDGAASSSSGVLSADASAEAPEEAGDDELGDESGAPSGPCLPDEVELTNVVLDVTQNLVQGEDTAAVFDEDSWACAYAEEGLGIVMVHYGPHAFGEPQNTLYFRLHDGVRSYDLATDPAPPGSGEDGAVDFGYSYQYESASFIEFSTRNQASTGTLDVIAHPLAGDATVEFTAVGTIAGDDGWEFDLHFTGDVVAE
jgi:hypothetical protein